MYGFPIHFSGDMVMRRSTLTSLALGAALAASTQNAAAALTSEQLIHAGFLCSNAGPHNWVHCLNGQTLGGGRRIQVLVFTVDGSIFLGTELLIHESSYNGQPCPQDGLTEWEPVTGIPYVACHHFATN